MSVNIIVRKPLQMIELICPHCQTPFQRKLYEHRKRIKKAKNPLLHFCSHTCRITYLNRVTRRDINTPFRRMFYHAKFGRKKTCLITLDDVREQWEKQKGICTY